MSPKRPLRDDVRQQVLERLLRGEFPPGSRINETTLATDLGVSRTPLREALLDLRREGFVRSDAARGFTVRALTAGEIREIYPMVWTLEGLALRTADRSPDDNELEVINGELAGAKGNPGRALELDSRWHAVLLAGCENRRLRAMISDLKLAIRRYEYAFMWNAGLIGRSVEQHREVSEALANGDLHAAVQSLENNWRTGMESLLEQMAGAMVGQRRIHHRSEDGEMR